MKLALNYPGCCLAIGVLRKKNVIFWRGSWVTFPSALVWTNGSRHKVSSPVPGFPIANGYDQSLWIISHRHIAVTERI